MKTSSSKFLIFSIYTDQKGFTLLEVIVTIIVAAIMGTMLVQFMGTSMIWSTKPVTQVQKAFSLKEVMDKITADHKKLLAEDSTPLATLKTNIENNNYGTYSSQTGYIRFTGGNEVVDGTGANRILKAKITSGDQTLTTLFTK